MQYKFKNYNEFILSGLEIILRDGREHRSRAGITKELENVQITIEDNSVRETLLIGRGNSPIATSVETLWVLAGSCNAKWLSTYLPRALEYSDNGVDWYNGYGPRLRDWHGKDQLLAAYAELKSNPESRRCVIGINDPLYCLNVNSKDIACNLLLNFFIRDNKLHLTVMSRSMDILWGSMVNFYEWSVLQRTLAGMLKIETGEYNHFITSLHLYEPFFEKADKMVRINKLAKTTEFFEKICLEFPRLVSVSDQGKDKIVDLYSNVFKSIFDPSYNLEFLDESKLLRNSWENYAVVCLIIGELLNYFKTTTNLYHDLFVSTKSLNVFDYTIHCINERLVPSLERFVLVEYLTRSGFIKDEKLNLSDAELKYLCEFRCMVESVK